MELKARVIKIIGLFFILLFLCYYFSDHLYKIILSPLVKVSGETQRKIIYTGLTEAFFSYIKISAFFAFLFVFPFLCRQIYAFIKPGLYEKERGLVSKLIAGSPLLFYAGTFFMFFIVMPKAWVFFVSYEQSDIGVPLVLEAKISEYLDIVIQLTFAFGLCFQVPVVLVILAALGIVTSQSLRNKRRIAIVLIFIAAAILTPPDVFSQIALAIPLLLLYEISIIMCAAIEKRFQS